MASSDPFGSSSSRGRGGGGEGSFRLLSYVNDLRLKNDAAAKECQELDASNQSLLENLKRDRKHARKLEREIDEMNQKTRNIKKKAEAMTCKIVEMESRKKSLMFENAALKAIEAETEKSLKELKQSVSDSLAKYKIEIQKEIDKSTKLVESVEQVEGKLKTTQVRIDTANEEGAAARQRIENMRHQKDALHQELETERQETQQAEKNLREIDGQITATAESLNELTAYRDSLKLQNERRAAVAAAVDGVDRQQPQRQGQFVPAQVIQNDDIVDASFYSQ